MDISLKFNIGTVVLLGVVGVLAYTVLTQKKELDELKASEDVLESSEKPAEELAN